MNEKAPEKGPGRPPLWQEDSVAVCVTLPVSAYDRLYERSRRDGISVPEVIRRDLSDRGLDLKYRK